MLRKTYRQTRQLLINSIRNLKILLRSLMRKNWSSFLQNMTELDQYLIRTTTVLFFGHYIQAIFKMKDELYNLKAVNRAYITKPQDGASTFIGEYEIRGTSFHMKDHSIKKAHLVCTRFRPHT